MLSPHRLAGNIALTQWLRNLGWTVLHSVSLNAIPHGTKCSQKRFDYGQFTSRSPSLQKWSRRCKIYKSAADSVPAQISDYLVAPPLVPPPISQQLRQFLCRFVIDDVRRNASAVIVQASEPLVGPAAITLLIDIDAFKENLAAAPEIQNFPKCSCNSGILRMRFFLPQ